MRNEGLGSWPARRARKTPHRTALIHGGTPLTYAQLYDRTTRLAHALRAAGHAGTALVALTGYGREDDIRRSLAAGFDHHLVKPIDAAQLRRIVLEVRGRRS